jgi:branched-chain amino acid aminotransferase
MEPGDSEAGDRLKRHGVPAMMQADNWAAQSMEVGLDTYYIDGKFVDDATASISVKDIVVLRGFGVFTFLSTYNKRPFHLQEHVRRLEDSARNIGLALNHTNTEICAIVEETVRRNSHHDESNIRIVYTGGVSADGVTPQGTGILLVMVTPRLILPDWWYAEGIKIITVDIQRFMPLAKSTNYLAAVFALRQAKIHQAIEAVYVDRDQRILEGTTTNFYFFHGDTLVTPCDGILPGITRGVLLDLAKNHFEVQLRDIKRDELPEMEEVFISASNKEVVPVVQVDDLTIGERKPGKNTRMIMQLFHEYTNAYGRGEI